jgi:hypothetical protein
MNPVFWTDIAQKVYDNYGITKDKTIYAYCHVGAGRSSEHITALQLLGYKNVKVFTGSWDVWGNDMNTGNIIVSASILNAPRGFLRKITAVSYSGGQTTVTTEDATIEEAAKGYLKEGQVAGDSASYMFKVSDTAKVSTNKSASIDPMTFPIDKTIETSSGLNLTVRGSLTVSPNFEKIAINIVNENGIPRFTSMYFLPETVNELEVTINSKLKSDFDKEWELVKLQGPTLVMNLGGLPVLVTPEVIFYVGVTGNLTADLDYHYFNKSQLRAGFAYTDQWILPHTNGLTVLEENSTASANVTGTCKVYVKPEFNLYFYDKDFVACGVNASPYARFNANLNVDNVDWSIYGGINSGAYFKAQLFGYSLVDQDWDDLITLPEWEIERGSYPFSNGVIPTDGLIAYFPFNGNANDESENHVNGTVNGGATLTSDRKMAPNSAYLFSGGYNDYIATSNSPVYNLGNNMSICAWVKPSQNGGYVVSAGRDVANGSFRLTDATFATQVNYNGVNGPDFVKSPSLNEWSFMVGTLDGLVSRFYLNGVFVNEATISSPFVANIDCHSLMIGRHSTYCTPTDFYPYPFAGAIDDVRLYDRALTESEILALYYE